MVDSLESKADGTVTDQPGGRSDVTHDRQREAAGDSAAAGPIPERAAAQVEDFTQTPDGELVEHGYGHGV